VMVAQPPPAQRPGKANAQQARVRHRARDRRVEPLVRVQRPDLRRDLTFRESADLVPEPPGVYLRMIKFV